MIGQGKMIRRRAEGKAAPPALDGGKERTA